MSKNKYWFFLFGLFVSAIGSNAFVLTMLNILKVNGMELGFLGLFVALSRFTGFLTQTIFGKIGDQISPKLVVAVSEVGAAVSSAALFFNIDNSGMMIHSKFIFLFFGTIRLFFMSLQLSSIQKIAKNFDSQLSLRGNPVIHLSLVSNLALFIMGVFTFLFFDEINLKKILILDTVTFLLNGLFIFFSPKLIIFDRKIITSPFRFSVSEYFKNDKQLFFYDMFLSLALFGANVLNLKLLSDHINWVPILTTSFGLAGVLASTKFFSAIAWYNKKLIWVILAASVLLQGVFFNQVYLVILFSIIRNFSYWLLLNSIGREFMQRNSLEDYASLSSSRQASITGILSTGEFLTGSFTLFTVPIENALRSFAAIVPIFMRNSRV